LPTRVIVEIERGGRGASAAAQNFLRQELFSGCSRPFGRTKRENAAMTSKPILTSATALVGFLLLTGTTGGSLAQDALPAGFKTQPLLKTGQTRDGEPIVYPTGKPEIISVTGTIEPGGRTPLHQHPVPVYVYVLEGDVELQTEGREPHKYKTGEAYIEALNRNHQLFNKGSGTAKVLVVFVGEEGKPTTVTAKSASK
jgi:quercetin dioxygenase-like cupin family protein